MACPIREKLRSGQWIKIPNGPFHCVITKSDYRLDVYLGSPGEAGSLFVTSFPVGLGKDNSTPTGTWIVAAGGKAHPATYYSPRGEGVIAADDPKNPLGGYWMGLTGVAGNALGKELLRHPRHHRARLHRQTSLHGLHPPAPRRHRPALRPAGGRQEQSGGEGLTIHCAALRSLSKAFHIPGSVRSPGEDRIRTPGTARGACAAEAAQRRGFAAQMRRQPEKGPGPRRSA